MDTIRLAATPRTVLGKKTKQLRRQGQTPGVLYGHGLESSALQMDTRELERVYRTAGRSTLVKLAVGGSETNVIIREITMEPLRRLPVHVDFYQVRMNEPITMDVPVLFDGVSPAVEEHDGVVVHLITSVSVRCLPGDIPHAFHVDLSSLTEIDQFVTVANLQAPASVEVLTDGSDIVAKVQPPQKVAEDEAEDQAAEEAAAAEATEPSAETTGEA